MRRAARKQNADIGYFGAKGAKVSDPMTTQLLVATVGKTADGRGRCRSSLVLTNNERDCTPLCCLRCLRVPRPQSRDSDATKAKPGPALPGGLPCWPGVPGGLPHVFSAYFRNWA